MFKLPFLKCLSVIKYLYTGWSISREIWEDTFCKHKIHSTWNVGGMIQLRLHLCFRVELELKLGFLRWCVLSVFLLLVGCGIGFVCGGFCVCTSLHLWSSQFCTFLLIARHSECLIPVDIGRQLDNYRQLEMLLDLIWTSKTLEFSPHSVCWKQVLCSAIQQIGSISKGRKI